MKYLLWTVITFLTLASPVEAGPAVAIFISGISGGLGVAAAGAAAFGGIGWALIKIGIGIALSALSQALAPKPKSNDPGIRTETTTQGGITPQSFILGTMATAGNLVAPDYAHGVSGKTNNAFKTRIIDISDLPMEALTEVIMGGMSMPRGSGMGDVWTGAVHPDYGQTLAAAGDTAKYSGKIWLKFYDGTQVIADPMLVAKYGSHPKRPWNSDRIGTGVAYAILTYLYDRELWQSGLDVRFAGKGVKLYDVRKDSTAGGSGTQRLATPATWKWTDNPVVMIWNILRGIPLSDGSVYGVKVAPADLPSDYWVAAMNACDALITGGQETAVSVAKTGDWSNVGATLTNLTLEALGRFPGLKVASAGSTTNRALSPSVALATGVTYATRIWYADPTDGSRSGTSKMTLYNASPSVNLEVGGPPGALYVITQTNGTVTSLTNTNHGGGIYSVDFLFTVNSAITVGWSVGPNFATAGKSIIALGVVTDVAKARYRAGYEVKMATAENGGDTPFDVIDELKKACSGSICDMGGTWLFRVAEASLPVYVWTDDDVVVSQPQELEPYRGMADTYNAVTASYPEPSQLWSAKEAPPRYDLTMEVIHGQRLVADLTLPAVPYAEQVQGLMYSLLRDERRQRRHTSIALPQEASAMTPLDCGQWTSTENGYVSKLFEVSSMTVDPNSPVIVYSLRERDPLDYDYTPVNMIPTVVTPTGVVLTTLDPLPGFTAVKTIITDASGTSRRVGIKLDWSTGLAGICSSIQWEVQVNATGVKIANGSTSAVDGGTLVLSEGLLPLTAYKVRARGWHQQTDWSSWTVLTTDAVYLSPTDLDPTAPGAPTALSVSTSVIADAQGRLVATWTAPATGAAVALYEVGINIGAAGYVYQPVYTPRFEANLLPNKAYAISVKAVSAFGIKSAAVTASGTSVKDSTAPAVPTGLTVDPNFKSLWLKWARNSEADFHHYDIYELDTSTPAPVAGTVATFSTPGNQMTRGGLANAQTKHYWIRAVDTSGNKSAWSARVQQTTNTNAGVVGADLAGLIDAASFAAGIKPVEVVATLPGPAHVAGRIVFLTSDNKLYRNDGTGWTKAVDGLDLIADSVTVGAVAAGAIRAREIAANTILSTNMALGDFENLFPGGSFSDGSVDWLATDGVPLTLITGGISGATRLRFEKNLLAGSATITPGIPRYAVVQGSRPYWFECVAKASSITTAGFYFRIRWYDEAYGFLSYDDIAADAALPTGPWATFASKVTSPFLARFAQWQIINWTTNTTEKTFSIDHVACRKADAANLMVDGSLTANMVSTASFETAGVALFGAGLQSTNYAESGGIPTAGFKLVASTGEIKGVDIITSKPMQYGSISQFFKGSQLSEVSVNNGTYAFATTTATGVISGDQNYIVGFALEAKAVTGAGGSFNGIYLQVRYKLIGGGWSSWYNVYTLATPGYGTAVAGSFLKTDRLDDLQYRFLLANSDPLNTVWAKNANIQIQSVVK